MGFRASNDSLVTISNEEINNLSNDLEVQSVAAEEEKKVGGINPSQIFNNDTIQPIKKLFLMVNELYPLLRDDNPLLEAFYLENRDLYIDLYDELEMLSIKTLTMVMNVKKQNDNNLEEKGEIIAERKKREEIARRIQSIKSIASDSSEIIRDMIKLRVNYNERLSGTIGRKIQKLEKRHAKNAGKYKRDARVKGWCTLAKTVLIATVVAAAAGAAFTALVTFAAVAWPLTLGLTACGFVALGLTAGGFLGGVLGKRAHDKHFYAHKNACQERVSRVCQYARQMKKEQVKMLLKNEEASLKQREVQLKASSSVFGFWKNRSKKQPKSIQSDALLNRRPLVNAY